MKILIKLFLDSKLCLFCIFIVNVTTRTQHAITKGFSITAHVCLLQGRVSYQGLQCNYSSLTFPTLS